MILSFGSLFVSCDDTLTLQSIKVTQKPTAEYQYLGESLDKTGMVVTGYYNKGYESVIADYTVSPEKFETIGTNTVTVSYKGKTDSFEVNVVRNDLESITIKNPPNKIAYKEGEKLTLTGMVVEANYKDGTVETITGYTTTPVEGTKLKTTNKKVIISYQNKTTEQSIVVVETPEPTPTPTATYTITYDANGGSGTAPAAQTGLYVGSAVVLAENFDASGDPILTRTNYAFMGWNTNPNGGEETRYAAGAVVENGFTGDTKLYAEWVSVDDLKRVGGRIYYINGDDNGATYRFFKDNGTEIVPPFTLDKLSKNSSESDNAYYYTRVPETVDEDSFVDKFYVAEKQSVVQNWSKSDPKGAVRKYDDSNYCVWATGNEDLTSASGIEVLSGYGDSKIGAGKKNTAWIFANRNNDTYFPAHATTPVGGNVTCWDFCKDCRTNSVNGCNDWFVPSIAECEALYKSGIWGALNTWVTTTKYGNNDYSNLWSSSANSSTYGAWGWHVDSSYSYADNYSRYSQGDYMFLAVVRAF